MERQINIEKYSTWFLIIIYSVGIIGHLYDKTLSIMLELTPFTLLICAALTIYSEVRNRNEFILWFSISYLITFTIEVIGVKSKVVFGDYYYSKVLGVTLLDVPLIIGVNWVIVVLGATSLAGKVFKNKIFAVIASGIIATLFDFLLEPVAIKLEYWNWFNNTIPLQNYLAWFIIASTISAFFLFAKVSIKGKLAETYLFVQVMFFLILNLFL